MPAYLKYKYFLFNFEIRSDPNIFSSELIHVFRLLQMEMLAQAAKELEIWKNQARKYKKKLTL